VTRAYRVEAIREACIDMFEDPGFLAEAMARPAAAIDRAEKAIAPPT
jgi:hypothetical protein